MSVRQMASTSRGCSTRIRSNRLETISLIYQFGFGIDEFFLFVGQFDWGFGSVRFINGTRHPERGWEVAQCSWPWSHSSEVRPKVVGLQMGLKAHRPIKFLFLTPENQQCYQARSEIRSICAVDRMRPTRVPQNRTSRRMANLRNLRARPSSGNRNDTPVWAIATWSVKVIIIQDMGEPIWTFYTSSQLKSRLRSQSQRRIDLLPKRPRSTNSIDATVTFAPL